MEIQSFESIAKNYKTIFFDAFGVLKNHTGLIPGIKETFRFLEKNNIDFFVITNDSSRGPEGLAEAYQREGLKEVTADRIISSGMLAKEYLKLKVKSGCVAYLGTVPSAHYIEMPGLTTVSIADLDLRNAHDVNALVFLDDEGFNWYHDINKAVNLLRQQNIPTIVCNTDKSYPMSQSDIAVAVGSIATMVENIIGKSFIRFGKPDAQMFIFAYEHSIENGGVADKEQILMVGDTLTTDILGGNKFGLDTALVLSGNTLPHQAEMRINTSGIIPTYICESAVIQHHS